MFSQSTRLQIRESILLSLIKSPTDGCQLQILPRDILWILCQFIASHEGEECEEVFLNTIYYLLMCYSKRTVPNITRIQHNASDVTTASTSQLQYYLSLT